MGEIPARSAVCALYDGDYHLGVGCLVNSLYRNGFRGTVWVGYRGPLPPWAQPVQSGATFDEFTVADGCSIRFVQLSLTTHLANAKPDFMLAVLTDHSPDAEAVFYFDVDIVIKCRWSFFEAWVTRGVALCLDAAYPYMPASHPLRGPWQDLIRKLELKYRDVDGYVNSGFVGATRQDKHFLESWAKLVRLLPNEGVSLDDWQLGDRTHPFNNVEQDMLNVALMATNTPISVAGPEAMDFTPAGYIMSHAVLSPKPWARNYLWWAAKGVSPSTADKMYWHYADGPIQFCSKSRIALQRAQLKLAAAIGRFYRRS
ncbi:MAG: hypothetical protein IIA72_05480 [Proteobacteria bacterium]|nr:hypothetical protein [Pseudomonadota bacterium]